MGALFLQSLNYRGMLSIILTRSHRVAHRDSDWIRTSDLLLRRQLLYPAELRNQIEGENPSVLCEDPISRYHLAFTLSQGATHFFCGTDWNRTSDTRIFSPLLYQLSYGTIITEDIFIWNLATTTNISYSFYTIVINIYELHTPLESWASSGLAAYRLRAYP